VGRVLKEHGLEPAPRRSRRTSWAEFLAAHWDQIAAADFFTVELPTLRGLVRYSILFVMEISTRTVHIAGISSDTGDPWMIQIARNLTDGVDGFLKDKTSFIHDRDPRFCQAFCDMIRDFGVEPKKLPARSPNLNAYAERFVRSIKSECLNRMIFFSEEALRRAIREYVVHYHTSHRAPPPGPR
jgi:transposase InsO family protein